MHFSHLIIVLLFAYSALAAEDKQKKKKDPRDFTDADIDRLYEEWEENDEEPLPDDEKPEHLRPKPNVDFDEIRQKVIPRAGYNVKPQGTPRQYVEPLHDSHFFRRSFVFRRRARKTC